MSDRRTCHRDQVARSPSPEFAREFANSLFTAAASAAVTVTAFDSKTGSGFRSSANAPEDFLPHVQQAWSRSGDTLLRKLGFPASLALLAVANCVANGDELTMPRVAIRAQRLWDSEEAAALSDDAMYQEFLHVSEL